MMDFYFNYDEYDACFYSDVSSLPPRSVQQRQFEVMLY